MTSGKMYKTPLLDQKHRSLDVFLSMLKESGISDRVDRVLVYGSVARGEADRESDVDVLVFSPQPKIIADRVADLSFETMLQTGDRIEALVYPSSQLADPGSYFLVQAIKEGRVMPV